MTTQFAGLPQVPPSDPSLSKPDASMVPRGIKTNFLAKEQAEGRGATVRRSIGIPKLRNFSPFLMLDHFDVGAGAGFPDHPHYGFETITYMLDGAMNHEDFTGSSGTIWPGDLQFMTAGRGVMHAEIPKPLKDGQNVKGMQLWVDLPQKLKNCEPRYRDLRGSEIPEVNVDDGKVTIKVISGQSHGVDSVKELAYTPVWLLDITIRPGGKVKQPLPAGFNAFAYTLQGTTTFGSTGQQRPIDEFNLVVFEQEGDAIVAEVPENSDKGSRIILAAGLPLNQTIVQYGPFVVSTREAVWQTFEDFQEFKNGFERGKGWQSEIAKAMIH